MHRTASRFALLLAWAVFVAACGPGGAPSPGRDEAARVAGTTAVADEAVLARVDGEPITARDVIRLMEDSEDAGDPERALRALIDQHLLASEAERRGLGDAAEVRIERGRALARALLEEIGRDVTAADLDVAEMERYYASRIERYVHGPQRLVVHAVILAGKGRLAPEEARTAAFEMGKALGRATDEGSFREIAAGFGARLDKALKVEKLPPFDHGSKVFVRSFVEAAFGAAGPGAVSAPFETTFGWHVLMVLEELPAQNRSFEEAKEEIAAQLLPPLREARFEEMMARLLKRERVVIREADGDGSGGPR
jgi:hypothetical protein